jgi:hypothetical protein
MLSPASCPPLVVVAADVRRHEVLRRIVRDLNVIREDGDPRRVGVLHALAGRLRIGGVQEDRIAPLGDEVGHVLVLLDWIVPGAQGDDLVAVLLRLLGHDVRDELEEGIREVHARHADLALATGLGLAARRQHQGREPENARRDDRFPSHCPPLLFK